MPKRSAERPNQWDGYGAYIAWRASMLLPLRVMNARSHGQLPSTKEVTMKKLSHLVARHALAAISTAFVLAGAFALAAPAHAVTGGTTTVTVISNQLRIYDGNAYDHNLSINDDGANSIWVGDVTGSVVVGTGCTAKTVSGVAGATCAKSGYTQLLVQYIGGDDTVFDNRTQGAARGIVAYLGAGADYMKMWHTSNNWSEIHGGFGNDWLIGSKSADTLYGDENDDQLSASQSGGAQAFDILNGGSGNDTLTSKNSQAGDTVNCGSGTDSASTDVSDTWSLCETVTH